MNNFPIFEYLDRLGIKYKKSGKNIGTGWIGLERCPKCGDSRYHFGVQKDSGAFNCWVCGTTGNLVQLIMLLEHVNAPTAIKTVRESTIQDIPTDLLSTLTEILAITPSHVPNAPSRTPKSLSLPEHLLPLTDAINRYEAPLNFLKNRGFEESDWDKWNAHYCFSGKYTQRIMFILNEQGQIVNYIGRSVIDEAPKRYLNCPREEMILSLKECVCGDLDKKEIILCEGIFDMLKMKKLVPDKGNMTLFGKQMSGRQKYNLMKADPKIVWVMLDMDAWMETIRLSQELSSLLMCPVFPLFPTVKDPGDYMSPEPVCQLFEEALA